MEEMRAEELAQKILEVLDKGQFQVSVGDAEDGHIPIRITQERHTDGQLMEIKRMLPVNQMADWPKILIEMFMLHGEPCPHGKSTDE